MLFAVGFALGSVWARLEVALIQDWGSRVLVIMMPVHLLLGGPAILVIFARFDGALPWSRVSFLVFGQVTWALELFVTSGFTAAFRCKFSS